MRIIGGSIFPDVGERYPKQLGGGQQQRVALARALILESSTDWYSMLRMRADLKWVSMLVSVTVNKQVCPVSQGRPPTVLLIFFVKWV